MGVVPSFRTVTPSSGLLSPSTKRRASVASTTYSPATCHEPLAPPRVKGEERGPSADFADELVSFGLVLGKGSPRNGEQGDPKDEPHNGVSVGTRKCQSVACW